MKKTLKKRENGEKRDIINNNEDKEKDPDLISNRKQ